MRRKRWAGTGIGGLGRNVNINEDQTYCTEAILATGTCQGVGVRVEWVYGIRQAANFESDINLGAARYNPYLADTFHGLQR
jgi:hypothetical protein